MDLVGIGFWIYILGYLGMIEVGCCVFEWRLVIVYYFIWGFKLYVLL